MLEEADTTVRSRGVSAGTTWHHGRLL